MADRNAGGGVRYAASEGVAEITLDAGPVNALNQTTIEAVIVALKKASADRDVRAVIVASARPRYFSAGLDLDALAKGGGSFRALLEKLYVEMTDVQYALGKPSIAAVAGAARGGGMTLAVSCNVIVAGESATFGYPEIDVGLIPAIHFVHLPAIVGRHRAFELLFSGRAFKADEAAALGLVSRIAPDASVLDEARALARVFAAKSPAAMRHGHAAFMRANDAGYRREIGHVVEAFCNIAAGEEAREGIRAFAEKRKPKW